MAFFLRFDRSFRALQGNVLFSLGFRRHSLIANVFNSDAVLA